MSRVSSLSRASHESWRPLHFQNSDRSSIRDVAEPLLDLISEISDLFIIMIGQQNISGRTERILETELRPGEHVLWCQQPLPAAMARKESGGFLFGIPFFAFAVFWTYAAAGGFDHSFGQKSLGGIGWFFVLWGCMFIAFGARILLSPLGAYLKALRTVYAITDQRAIIITAGRKQTVFSFVDQQLIEIHRVHADDKGRGDIVFHRQVQSGRRGDYYYETGFAAIENVREVEDKLRELHRMTANNKPQQFS